MTRTPAHLAYALFPSRGVAAWLGRTWRPSAFLAFPFGVLVVVLTWSGLLYPLRPDAIGAVGHPFTADAAFAGAWGGPTLAGAWFVHAMCALGMQVVCMAVIRRVHGPRPTEAVQWSP
jgi:hypothetical protein